MRERMKALDDLEMGDLWAQALRRTPQLDPDPEPRRDPVRTRIVAAVVAIAVFLLAAVFALNAFDQRERSVGGARPVPAANCPESLPKGAIAVVTCEQATDQAWGVAAFMSAADSAQVSWREYPGSFEGQMIPSWLITFGDAHFVEGNDGCIASGSLPSYTVVVSASSGALLASDGPPEGCSVVQRIAPLVELPSDPCALVTSDQVGAATSSNVLSSRLLDDSDLKLPGPPYPCDFETDGRFGHVGVVSVPNDPQGFTDVLNKDPVNREIVSGIGDGAFIGGGSEIVVALGDGYYWIGVQHGAGTEAEPPLRRLADDVLRNQAAVANETDIPSTPSAPSGGIDRTAVYEAMIRYLASSPDTEGDLGNTIHVRTNLCSIEKPDCGDRLTSDEEVALSIRLRDLGDIRFVNNFTDGDPVMILLGPIEQTSDGIRVEGGSVCGGLCGSGGTYIVEPVEEGYAVTGLDSSQARWIA